MSKIINSPGKFIVGSKEIENIGSYARDIGHKALVLITDSGKKRLEQSLKACFTDSSIPVVYEYFGRECSKQEIHRIREAVKAESCDVIIGIGGGKLLDTAKAVAYHEGLPVIVVPTIASTDAPCSALSVLYTEDGVFDEYLFLPSNPNVVIMDTEVIVQSPLRLTVAGMGDALATYFEARACQRKDAATCAGGKQTIASMALAQLCYDTLLEEGSKALASLKAGVATDAVEKIVEANTYLSGIGFESGGLAAAHAIHNGLTVLHECHAANHGEKVAFGTIAQLFLEDTDRCEIDEVLDFCHEVGLPTTLNELGVKEINREELMKVAEAACAEGETIYNMPFEITKEKVLAAILAADSYAKEYR